MLFSSTDKKKEKGSACWEKEKKKNVLGEGSVLAQNLRFLLENRLTREQMGMEGRKKVQRMFLKQHMYEKYN